ncbi:MAG: acyl-CoA dehydrogenase family protein [Acidimicrobiales bacterium]
MDFELPDPDDPRRQEIKVWLTEHPHPGGDELAEAGLVAPHWPRPYGREADPVMQLIIDDELKKAGVSRPVNPIGIGWAGPTILHAGTPDQQARYLPGLLSGAEIWCQLFSEPGAGSDLAGLATRAEHDGDEWVVNGSKVWTSLAHVASFGILIARTDNHAPRHQGISYFVCPMDAPGVTIRPIVEMTGAHTFNEVFLDNVRLPQANLVGEVNRGWGLAKVTLSNERVSLSGEGALWGRGPTALDLIDVVRRNGGAPGALMRQRLAQLYSHAEILRLIRLRAVTAAVKGRPPGPEASVRKALSDRHGQDIMALAKDLAGPAGMLSESGPMGTSAAEWAFGYLFAPALTIGGGTSEVQRNIIGERVLGLPHEPEVMPISPAS